MAKNIVTVKQFFYQMNINGIDIDERTTKAKSFYGLDINFDYFVIYLANF